MTLSPSFPFSQPPVVSLLIIISFLYLLNAVFVLANLVAHAGIVAQIMLGTIYGAPLGGILSSDWEATFMLLGYLGLICLVLEGGLSTNLPLLLSNLPLSCLCAATGVGCPIALSFALLQAGYGYRPLEAFAAGAALSSTSLGTTLAALNSVTRQEATSPGPKESCNDTVDGEELGAHLPRTSTSNASLRGASSPSEDSLPHRYVGSEMPSQHGEEITIPLQQSRIGTVLISAAMIDDVIGLVISAIIPALAVIDSPLSPSSGASNLTWLIIKPILSSILIAAISPIMARFVLRPLFWYRGLGPLWCGPRLGEQCLDPRTRWDEVKTHTWSEAQADFVKVTITVLVASAYIAIAYYTGSSMLFGAYIAGLMLSYICRSPAQASSPESCVDDKQTHSLSFEDAYSRVLGPIQNYILAPLFFASIGFAIPFISLWNGKVLWRGIVYSVLMLLGKLAVGLPILLWSVLPELGRAMSSKISNYCNTRKSWQGLSQFRRGFRRSSEPSACVVSEPPPAARMQNLASTPQSSDSDTPSHTGKPPSIRTPLRQRLVGSILPATFMGVAMVARGEIGLLIAQIARGSDSSDELLNDEAFLVCIWAILLCTIIGPVSVGVIVRRSGPSLTSGMWA